MSVGIYRIRSIKNGKVISENQLIKRKGFYAHSYILINQSHIHDCPACRHIMKRGQDTAINTLGLGLESLGIVAVETNPVEHHLGSVLLVWDSPSGFVENIKQNKEKTN